LAEAQPKLVVLDRDGVINFDSTEYIKRPEEWRPIPGSMEAIARLHRHGFRVFVVTNQSGVGRGLFTLATLERIHDRMRAAVTAAGGAIEGIYFCPHEPTAGCDCRKPGIGLLRRLEQERSLSLAGAPLVGDKWSDLVAARAVGARPILVLTGAGQSTLAAHGQDIEECYADLANAVAGITDGSA
jgi:D-glycero-D-manno-heptose 1,7-bisphosphate phosphatase